MPQNNDCRKRIRARMGESAEGHEGLEKEERRQDRYFEKAVMRSMDDDPDLQSAEEEHERNLVEIETDDGARGSGGRKK